MACKLFIQTSRSNPDSLKKPIKVAFTLTPAESNASTVHYDPVVRWVENFRANVEEVKFIDWWSRYAFGRYRVRGGKCVLEDRNGEEISYAIPPGHYVEMFRPGKEDRVDWRSAKQSVIHMAVKQFSVIAVNETGRRQNVALLIEDADGECENFNPIAVYNPLEDGDRCIAPSELMLQAYVIQNPSIEVGSILRREDATCPILQTPLSCDALPSSSIWKLYQDPSGAIRLRNDSRPANGLEAKVDELTQSIADLKAQFSALERSVTRAQDGVEAGHQAIAELRTQVSKIPQPIKPNPLISQGPVLDRNTPALEAQTRALAKSFTQTQEYLSSVQKYLQNTREQVASLDFKVPAIESKVDKLAESFNHTQDTVSAGLAGLGLRVSVVEGKEERLREQMEQLRDANAVDTGSPAMFPSRGVQPSTSMDSPKMPGNDFPDFPVFEN